MTGILALHCPTCAASIAAEDVNLVTALAKCRDCDAVFGIRDQIDSRGGAAGAETSLVERPGGLRMEEDVNGFRLRRSWRSPVLGFMILFTLFWDGFLVFWYIIAFTQNGPPMMKLFPILHVLIGVFVTWYTLALLLNTTTIDVNYERVRITHRPVWWPGSRTLDAASLVRLETRASPVERNGQRLWNVMADTTDDRRIALVANLDERDQARYIEQEIERFLDIKERTSKAR